MSKKDRAAVKRLNLPLAAGDNTYPNFTSYTRPHPKLVIIEIIDLCYKYLNVSQIRSNEISKYGNNYCTGPN
jgi:hypothetical protein